MYKKVSTDDVVPGDASLTGVRVIELVRRRRRRRRRLNLFLYEVGLIRRVTKAV